MTVISTATDPEQLTLTVTAEFAATPEQVWDVWEDPRKLERWWGPPSYPATFTRHDFTVGGESRYHMTGPSGDTPRGWWRTDVLKHPTRIEFANGLAGHDGEPEPGESSAPTVTTIDATDDAGDATRMTIVTHFVDLPQMEKMIGMGMEQGMGMAVGQIDALLSDG